MNITRLPMSEAQWMKRITDYCDLRGLRYYHSGDSRRDSSPGWPDLAVWGVGGFLVAELKREKGRLTVEQVTTLNELRHAGVEVHVWRPSQWDEVRARLDLLAGKRPKATA